MGFIPEPDHRLKRVLSSRDETETSRPLVPFCPCFLGIPKVASFEDFVMKKFALSFVLFSSISVAARAADSVTILQASFVQGTVKSSLAVAGYQNTSMNLGAWPLTTGGNSAISFENPQFQKNDLIAFGNGGTITMQFNTPITPVAGEKDLGIFTAQALVTSGAFFNGDMEAAILVSSDDVNWYNLTGQLIANPTSYTAQAYQLNAPTMAYNYATGATAWSAGGAHLTAAQLAALSVATFTTPMPEDSLFNNPASTNAQRAALTTDSSTADYNEEFGTSGGGNWFDVSGSGLSSVDYVMLNGDANDPATGGVRLTEVFANSSAVPEPTGAVLLIAGIISLTHRRNRTR
jgi:hypothetical protein